MSEEAKKFTKPAPPQVQAASARVAQHFATTMEPVPPVGPGNEPIIDPGTHQPVPAPVPSANAPIIDPNAPPAEPGTSTPAEPVEDDYKARYDALKGKYDAEVPRMHEQVRNLEQLLGNLSIPAAPTPLAPLGDITDAERAEYGPELIDIIRRVARSEFQPQIQEVHGRFDAFGASLDGAKITAAHDARDAMFAFMDTHVPGWKEQNASPEFVNWLAVVDIFARQPRQALLTEAWNANDAQSVAAFFLEYRKATGTAQPPAGGTPAVPGAPAAPAAPPAPSRPTLETFAAPGRAGAPAAAPGLQDKKIFHPNDISTFYRDKSLGRYRGRENEAAAMEKEIAAALKEGRVVR